MSDVDDWTGVSAGATTVIASGSSAGVFSGTPGRYNNNINLTDIPQTTRSILVLAELTAITGGASCNFAGVGVFGGVTGISWPSSSPALSTSGSSTVQPNSALGPQYFPLYGAVDSSALVQLSFSLAVTLNYWILALPDADLLGTPLNPLVVGNSQFPAVQDAAGAGLAVVPESGSTWSVSAPAGDPTPHTAHTAHTATANNTTAVLLAPPAAGTLWEVVHLGVLSGTTTANAANFLAIKGTTSAGFYVIAYEGAVGTEGHSDATQLLSEGLTFQAAGISGQAIAVARAVTQI